MGQVHVPFQYINDISRSHCYTSLLLNVSCCIWSFPKKNKSNNWRNVDALLIRNSFLPPAIFRRFLSYFYNSSVEQCFELKMIEANLITNHRNFNSHYLENYSTRLNLNYVLYWVHIHLSVLNWYSIKVENWVVEKLLVKSIERSQTTYRKI